MSESEYEDVPDREYEEDEDDGDELLPYDLPPLLPEGD